MKNRMRYRVPSSCSSPLLLRLPADRSEYDSRSFSAALRREVGKSMPDGTRRLRRSRNRVIAGVCGGIAEWLGWPANRVRIAYVIVSIVSAAFPGTLAYLVLWFLMPGPEDCGAKP